MVKCNKICKLISIYVFISHIIYAIYIPVKKNIGNWMFIPNLSDISSMLCTWFITGTLRYIHACRLSTNDHMVMNTVRTIMHSNQGFFLSLLFGWGWVRVVEGGGGMRGRY